MVSFKENALMYSYISYVMNENNLSYSSQCFILSLCVTFFFIEFQLMTSTRDDNFSSSDQDTNQFLCDINCSISCTLKLVIFIKVSQRGIYIYIYYKEIIIGRVYSIILIVMGGKVLTFNYLIKYPTLHGFNIFFLFFFYYIYGNRRQKKIS